MRRDEESVGCEKGMGCVEERESVGMSEKWWGGGVYVRRRESV